MYTFSHKNKEIGLSLITGVFYNNLSTSKLMYIAVVRSLETQVAFKTAEIAAAYSDYSTHKGHSSLGPKFNKCKL